MPIVIYISNSSWSIHLHIKGLKFVSYLTIIMIIWKFTYFEGWGLRVHSLCDIHSLWLCSCAAKSVISKPEKLSELLLFSLIKPEATEGNFKKEKR